MKFIKYLFVIALLFALFILPALAQSNISIMPPTNSVVADPTMAAQPAGVAALIGIIPLLVPIVVMLVKMGLPRLPSWSLPIIAVSLGALIDFISSKAHGPGVGPIMGALLGAAGIGVREIVDQVKSRIGSMPTTGLSVLALCLFLPLAGCTTTQQRTNFNTLSSVEDTATATVDGYFLAAAKGLADTNGIPKVAKAYNEFQGVMQVAVLLAENNSNALAPNNVMQELSLVVSAVGQFSPKTPITTTTPTP